MRSPGAGSRGSAASEGGLESESRRTSGAAGGTLLGPDGEALASDTGGLQGMVEENPMLAAAVSLGVGLIVGLVIGAVVARD